MSAVGFAVGFAVGAALGAPGSAGVSVAPGGPGYFTADAATSPSSFGQGDLEPDLILVVAEVRPEGPGLRLMDLSDIESASMRWRRPDGTLVTRELEVVTGQLGRLRYQWQAGDTGQVGEHRAQALLTWPGGEVQTVPSSDQPFRWRVRASI